MKISHRLRVSAAQELNIKKDKKQEKMPFFLQVVLRWALERGVSLVTKSCNTDRLAQNLDLFSFQLSDQDIEYVEIKKNIIQSNNHFIFILIRQIGEMEQKLRFNDPGYFCPKLYNTQCPIWD